MSSLGTNNGMLVQTHSNVCVLVQVCVAVLTTEGPGCHATSTTRPSVRTAQHSMAHTHTPGVQSSRQHTPTLPLQSSRRTKTKTRASTGTPLEARQSHTCTGIVSAFHRRSNPSPCCRKTAARLHACIVASLLPSSHCCHLNTVHPFRIHTSTTNTIFLLHFCLSQFACVTQL